MHTPSIVVFLQRDRARALVKRAFPHRRGRVVVTRTAQDFGATFKQILVDAAVVDVGSAQDETWRAAALAREYPSVAFFGIAALRVGEGPALAQCAAYDFADVLVDGVDDLAARELLGRMTFSSRFAAALCQPPPSLGLASELQLRTWRIVVSEGGRPVRTATLASELEVTREHLSRTFSADGSPNL